MRLASKFQRARGDEFVKHAESGGRDGSWSMVVGNVSVGPWGNGAVLFLHQGLRKDIKREAISMIYVTLAVVAFLFVYLVAALLRPEWF